jgi:hypothetical protein
MEEKSNIDNLLKLLSEKWKEEGTSDPFKLLVIGVTGSGKSKLLNNILGKEIAKVGETAESESTRITKYSGLVKGVKVNVYDSPGLLDTRGGDEENLKKISKWMKIVDVVVFCFKMIEMKLTPDNIQTFVTYHNIGVPWNKTVIALTFADIVPLFTPHKPAAEVYMARRGEWETSIKTALGQTVGLSEDVIAKIPFRCTTISYETPLPNGDDWFSILWISILRLLEPLKRVEFVEMFKENISIKQLQSRSPGTRASFTEFVGSESRHEIPMKIMHGKGKEPERHELQEMRSAVLGAVQKKDGHSTQEGSTMPSKKSSTSDLSSSESGEYGRPRIVIEDDSEAFRELAEAISELVTSVVVEAPKGIYEYTKGLIRSKWSVV